MTCNSFLFYKKTYKRLPILHRSLLKMALKELYPQEEKEYRRTRRKRKRRKTQMTQGSSPVHNLVHLTRQFSPIVPQHSPFSSSPHISIPARQASRFLSTRPFLSPARRKSRFSIFLCVYSCHITSTLSWPPAFSSDGFPLGSLFAQRHLHMTGEPTSKVNVWLCSKSTSWNSVLEWYSTLSPVHVTQAEIVSGKQITRQMID